jgi:hypothetical protein
VNSLKLVYRGRFLLFDHFVWSSFEACLFHNKINDRQSLNRKTLVTFTQFLNNFLYLKDCGSIRASTMVVPIFLSTST